LKKTFCKTRGTVRAEKVGGKGVSVGKESERGIKKHGQRPSSNKISKEQKIRREAVP